MSVQEPATARQPYRRVGRTTSQQTRQDALRQPFIRAPSGRRKQRFVMLKWKEVSRASPGEKRRRQRVLRGQRNRAVVQGTVEAGD